MDRPFFVLMDRQRQLLLTITVSQPWGDSARDWMQKGIMA
jgi:hypothetical protein